MTTENKKLAIYDAAKASLAELEKEFGDVIFDTSNKKGFTECKAVATKFQKLRTGIEKTRKDANADANAHIKRVNEYAKGLQERIAPLEERFAAPNKEYKEKLKALIAKVDSIPDVCNGRDSAFISEQMQWLETVNGDHLYEAKEKKDLNASLFTANEKINALFEEALAKEEQERIQKEEQEKRRIEGIISGMKAKVSDAMDWSAGPIKEAIEEVELTIIDDSFGDRQEEAKKVQSDTIKKLNKLLALADDDEEEELPFIPKQEEPSFELDEDDEDAEMFKDCVADAGPQSEAVNFRAAAFDKLLELTGGDYDLSNTLLQEIESGRVPGVQANF